MDGKMWPTTTGRVLEIMHLPTSLVLKLTSDEQTIQDLTPRGAPAVRLRLETRLSDGEPNYVLINVKTNAIAVVPTAPPVLPPPPPVHPRAMAIPIPIPTQPAAPDLAAELAERRRLAILQVEQQQKIRGIASPTLPPTGPAALATLQAPTGPRALVPPNAPTGPRALSVAALPPPKPVKFAQFKHTKTEPKLYYTECAAPDVDSAARNSPAVSKRAAPGAGGGGVESSKRPMMSEGRGGQSRSSGK